MQPELSVQLSAMVLEIEELFRCFKTVKPTGDMSMTFICRPLFAREWYLLETNEYISIDRCLIVCFSGIKRKNIFYVI